MREIVAEIVESLESKRLCVLCSLVETRGSTPQKAGAAMLVFADGSQAGTLGGGCVEAEVKQRALRMIEDSSPQLMTFNLDNDYGWDDGLICGGRMLVAAQPIRADSVANVADYFRILHGILMRGAGCTEAICIESMDDLAAGTRFLFDPQGQQVAFLGDRQAPESIAAHLPDLSTRPRSSTKSGVAYLPTWERITLLIVGGGHVGEAVGKLAAECDFDIWILDDRESFASAERFPAAQRRIVGDLSRELKKLREKDITPNTFCIIVTRGHAHDEEALFHLAECPADYVGMIGSKRKIRLIFEDLIAKGISEETLQRVHAPLGIDIASRTVPEIAISIVAELIAHRNKSVS